MQSNPELMFLNTVLLNRFFSDNSVNITRENIVLNTMEKNVILFYLKSLNESFNQ